MDNSQQDVVAAPEPSPYATPAPEPKRQRSALATASLVLGILALVGALIPFINYVSGVLATVGAVLGLVALIQKRARGTALAGLIISVVAIILSVILAIVYTAGFAASVADSVSSKPVASVAPEDKPFAEDAGPAVGARENPAPIGTPISLSVSGAPAWEITPGAPTLNAGDAIAAENQFNEAAVAGEQWAMLPVTIKYVGTKTGNPSFDIQVKFVSAAGTTHQRFDHAAVVPNDLSSTNEMYPGASATGNVAIMVPSADVEKGTWVISGLFGDDFFFAAQ